MASSSVSPVIAAGDSQCDESTTAQHAQQTSATEGKAPISTTITEVPPSASTPQPTVDEDDDESDFDELDEALDNFKPQPASDAPPTLKSPAPAPGPEDLDEAAFMNQLEQDMARMMSQAAQQSGAADDDGFESAVNQGADAFTKQLEESGIPPGDFLKQLLADVMAEEGFGGENSAVGEAATAATSVPGLSASGSAPAGARSSNGESAPESFNDAIQRTINRMKESGDKATAAAEEDNTDDLVAQLLKAIEAGTDGAGDDADLTKMFMGMMEQLSNKDMLYEPMKELDTKFGPWLKKNRGDGKVSQQDMARYEKQASLVSQIVTKFEEPTYTDEDPKCREYVWERMQEMQAAGNPPDELVANPWMDDLKGAGPPGAGMPDCPQQ